MAKLIVTIGFLAVVSASVSFVVAETRLFKPIREWIRGGLPFFGSMVSCGFCLGHWVAFALVAVYKPRLFEAWVPLDYFLTALVIAWLGGFQWAVMCILVSKAGK
jgi:hypothetical protein